MNNKPTITIGIPAYNEEQNIANMLDSVLAQKGSFKLEKIIVACDGCLDKTPDIVRKFQMQNKNIILLEGKRREGKLYRLNQIYKRSKSDILLTFDGDILLSNETVIEKMISKLTEDKNVILVVAHQVPVKPTNFKETIFYTAYKIWEETRVHVNEGDHIHNLQGAAVAMRAKLAKKLRYPKTLTTDQGYLYLFAKKYGKFKYAYQAIIFYRVVKTLKDFRRLSQRTLHQDQQTAAKHFGKEALNEYKIPVHNKLKALIINFVKSPLFTSLAILVNLYVRLFPLNNNGKPENKWKIVTTTKEVIHV
ncbi:hypothetical protein A2714_03880 [Candidatus Woesebacteria bacterium RIFCSPHIGHO2_01_FULL_38_9]|uniref:Glycosyltransferase 2-like domain-containing protein n=2 Tax=Candidatus Woeseibacteriota TaxID=1752722 RepID=A0A1F7XZQ3_9BACT|nr:MAG: hypothetical protein A2714_03880 [Candidatus Woesebacteria bacterium RIFCSPHIGHO2_01_FULL_38_9]OGM60050.1 MAG: hypothetical protein A3A75_01450 [Candidatus Woesebacteria bacterium RIFCSPLOWO2_01_FULL_39_10]